MVLNKYEHTKISNKNLPDSWKSQSALDSLSDFLQDNWRQRSVFYEDGEIHGNQQFIEFTGQKGLKTKKYIGSIVFRGEQLNIYPKIFRSEKEDEETDELSQKHLLNNLVFWIGYCNKINYPFLNISSEFEDLEDFKDLFITLYVGYVRTAIDRGLFYKYTEETEDCDSIRGRFNVRDYVQRKIPNGQANKFNCTFSKFEFDNKVNQIIKFTCKYLLKISSNKNRKVLRIVLSRLEAVSDTKCVPSDCDNIRLSRLHSQYAVIISMSKMFMLNRNSNYTMDSQESFCFLFPTELLFEGFFGGVVQEFLRPYKGHAIMQESKMSLVEKIIYRGTTRRAAFKMRHDILANINGKTYILDTKYKELSRFENNEDIAFAINTEVRQNDMYQVLEYARKRNLNHIYLIYPMYRYEMEEKEFPIAVSESPTGDINVHLIRIPFVIEDDKNIVIAQLRHILKILFEISG